MGVTGRHAVTRVWHLENAGPSRAAFCGGRPKGHGRSPNIPRPTHALPLGRSPVPCPLPPAHRKIPLSPIARPACERRVAVLRAALCVPECCWLCVGLGGTWGYRGGFQSLTTAEVRRERTASGCRVDAADSQRRACVKGEGSMCSGRGVPSSVTISSGLRFPR